MSTVSDLPARMHPEQMLTTEQVATLTGISKQTLEGWRCRNPDAGPKFKKLGPQLVRYRWLDVQNWINRYDTTSAA